VLLSLDEFALHMGPAVGETNARIGRRQGLIGPISVADDDALVVLDESRHDLGRTAGVDTKPAGIVGRESPGPPLLGRLLLHQAPPGLINADDVEAEDVLAQCLVGWFQPSGQRLDLVPQGLRRDKELLACHLLALSLEGLMLDELLDRHLDSEIERIAPAGNRLDGRRCCGQTEPTLASVLLSLDLLDHELSPEHRDLFAVLGHPGDLLQRPLAFTTDAFGHRQLHAKRFSSQFRLRPGAMPPLLLLWLLAGLWLATATFTRVAKEPLLQGRHLLLDAGQLQLQLLLCPFSFQLRILPYQLLQSAMQSSILGRVDGEQFLQSHRIIDVRERVHTSV
jgi:hypothetical protein